MKVQTNVKMEAAQKELFGQAARDAQEDFTEFLLNSAMLRIERRMLSDKPAPPFAAVGKLYLEEYHPNQVSNKDAEAIAVQLDKARKGQLKFKKIGSVLVTPPEKKSGDAGHREGLDEKGSRKPVAKLGKMTEGTMNLAIHAQPSFPLSAEETSAVVAKLKAPIAARKGKNKGR